MNLNGTVKTSGIIIHCLGIECFHLARHIVNGHSCSKPPCFKISLDSQLTIVRLIDSRSVGLSPLPFPLLVLCLLLFEASPTSSTSRLFPVAPFLRIQLHITHLCNLCNAK